MQKQMTTGRNAPGASLPARMQLASLQRDGKPAQQHQFADAAAHAVCEHGKPIYQHPRERSHVGQCKH
ncbi:MAG TPA: hypothetical protein VGC21_09350 [Telluria sp.]|jgi:hypothetical protein